jgi:hypothetical protein
VLLDNAPGHPSDIGFLSENIKGAVVGTKHHVAHPARELGCYFIYIGPSGSLLMRRSQRKQQMSKNFGRNFTSGWSLTPSEKPRMMLRSTALIVFEKTFGLLL